MKLPLFLFLTLFNAGLLAAGKTGFINSQELLRQSPQAIAAKETLQEQFSQRELDLRKMAQSIQQMEATYKNDSAIMSSEQKQKAEENIIQNKRRFQFEQQSLQEDLQSRRAELLRQVEIEIRAVIQSYGQRNGYDFIFTDVGIAFANEAVDLTGEILQELGN